MVNTSNASVMTGARFRAQGKAEEWDVFTGETLDVDPSVLKLAPYESKVIVFGGGGAPVKRLAAEAASIDISSDWRVNFEGLHKEVSMPQLHSWTVDSGTQFYSGKAVYEKTIDVAANFSDGRPLVLDFGEGEKVTPAAVQAPGMRALLESPVRECALVYVNGKPAGSVWHPPYQVDVTHLIHSGRNDLRIVVANLAINEMAGSALPIYKLLNARYGERFTPQGFENLHAVPAGLLGPVTLVRK